MAYSDGTKALLSLAKTNKKGTNLAIQLLVNAAGKNYKVLTPKAKKALNLICHVVYDAIVAGGGPG